MISLETTDTNRATEASRPGLLGRLARRLGRATIIRDRRGTAAIEFGIVALPFFALMGAIFESALSFLAGQVLDTAVADAARLIRTGQAQASSYSKAQFTAEVCKRLYVLLDCAGVQIEAKVYTSFSSATPVSPIDVNGNFDPSKLNFQMGGSSEIVVVRAFYQYPLYFNRLGFDLSNLSNGKRLLTGVSAFRNEPFPW